MATPAAGCLLLSFLTLGACDEGALAISSSSSRRSDIAIVFAFTTKQNSITSTMRFKAKLAPDQVHLLTSIITPLSKLGGSNNNNNNGIVYLDPEFVRISIKDVDSNINCFAELANNMLFMDHRIESAANNVILCQLDLISLKLALQSITTKTTGSAGSNSSNNNRRNNSNSNNTSATCTSLMDRLHQPVLTMKLAKRNSLPCLCLEGTTQQHHASLDIYQAIPIRILRAQEMKLHLPPAIPTPTVQLEIPTSIRPMVEKFKVLGSTMYLQASMKGDLTLRFDQEGKASVASFYNQLQPQWDTEDQDAENLDQTTTTLKVDSQKLAMCLSWQQPSLPISSCLLGMVPNEMLVLHVVLNPERVGFFTYYLPVYYMDPEELAQQQSQGTQQSLSQS